MNKKKPQEITIRSSAAEHLAFVEELSKSLTLEYGRGYSIRNLFNMLKFYEVFNDQEILHTVCAKLSWSHLRQIMYIEEIAIILCVKKDDEIVELFEQRDTNE